MSKTRTFIDYAQMTAEPVASFKEGENFFVLVPNASDEMWSYHSVSTTVVDNIIVRATSGAGRFHRVDFGGAVTTTPPAYQYDFPVTGNGTLTTLAGGEGVIVENLVASTTATLQGRPFNGTANGPIKTVIPPNQSSIAIVLGDGDIRLTGQFTYV